MRIGALAMVLLVTACGQGDGGNGTGAAGNGTGAAFAGDTRDVAAILALAASGPGGCSARWDGQPATLQQVLERSSALVERAIQQEGGVANLTEETLPAVAVTAPASLGFACVDTYLGAVRRSGVATLLLTPDRGVPALADFTLSDIGGPPPSIVLGVGAGGRLSWNQEAITLDALPEHVSRLSGGDGAPAETVTARGELELRPSREATFGQLHAALSAVRAGNVRAALLLPSVQPSRRPAPVAAAPAPPLIAPPADNETAPRP
jgi:hypothetical protein